MKLVRDKIQELFPDNSYRIATPTEKIFLLRKKMLEELLELLQAENSVEFLEEMADLMEVANSLRECYGWTQEDLDRVRQEKLSKRGGFETNLVLE